jgi:hypothetical protein
LTGEPTSRDGRSMAAHVLAARAFAVVTFVAAGAVLLAGCPRRNEATAGATRPMGPAEGASDYKYSPGGPHEPAAVPQASGEPEADAPPASDCPPKCGSDGAWTGCGLNKPRGANCQNCVPKCKGKGTKDEGWYDCAGMLIAQRACSS